MLTNYVLSFCRITKSSRIFSRTFYLPLLKPLTPREAFRTFRITGKWLLGVKHQRYIPVLLNHKKKRSKKLKNYGKVKHKYDHDFMYMSPVLDPENEQHQQILENLVEKNGAGKGFVYQVDDRNYQIVFSSKLEAAIRSGEIIDVLVSHIDDKILVKLKNMKKVALEIATYDGEANFYKGEGTTTEEDEKFHHYGKETMTKAKHFEEKEKVYEEWENELNRLETKRKKNRAEGTVGWKKIMKTAKDAIDWDKFEEDAKTIVDHIMEPVSEANILMDLRSTEVNVNAVDHLEKCESLVEQLPRVSEIPDIVRNMFTGVPHELETDMEPLPNGFNPVVKKRRVSGVKVKLSTGQERFVTGQMIATEDGDMFIPGQTIRNGNGSEYEPGIIVNMSNQVSMLNGLILGEEDRVPIFVPTDTVITSDGQLTFAMSAEERPKLRRRKIQRGVVEPPVFKHAEEKILQPQKPLQAKLFDTVEEYVPEDVVVNVVAINLQDDVDVEAKIAATEADVVVDAVLAQDNDLINGNVVVQSDEDFERAERVQNDVFVNECQEVDEKITLNDLIATIEGKLL